MVVCAVTARRFRRPRTFELRIVPNTTSTSGATFTSSATCSTRSSRRTTPSSRSRHVAERKFRDGRPRIHRLERKEPYR